MKNNYSKLYRDYYYSHSNLVSTRESVGITFAGIMIIAVVIVSITISAKAVYSYITRPINKRVAELEIIDTDKITNREIYDAQKRCDEWLKRENELAPQREYEAKCEELKSKNQIGDWIKITWWGDLKNGSDAPADASCTGQIRHIDGDTISGTWGNYKLQYDKAHWQTIKKSEYLELRATEQRRRDRQARKKNYGLWGVRMPGSYSENTKERVWWDNPEVYAREKRK